MSSYSTPGIAVATGQLGEGFPRSMQPGKSEIELLLVVGTDQEVTNLHRGGSRILGQIFQRV